MPLDEGEHGSDSQYNDLSSGPVAGKDPLLADEKTSVNSNPGGASDGGPMPYQYWNLALLAITFSLSQSILTGNLTVSPLIIDSLGYGSLSTLPVAAVEFGSMFSASLVGLSMLRYGRKVTFVGGALFGTLGCVGCSIALLLPGGLRFAVLVLGCVCVGVWSAAAYFVRFCAAEVVERRLKDRAVSIVLVGSSVCGSAGPQLAAHVANFFPTKYLAFYLISVVMSIGAALLAVMLRLGSADRDPRDPEADNEGPVRESSRKNSAGAWTPIPDDDDDDDDDIVAGANTGPETSLWELASSFRVRLSMFTASVAMFVMLIIMGATSLAMTKQFNYSLTTVSTVIQCHVAAMFLPCLITGDIIKRIGKVNTMLCGSACFAVSIIIGFLGHDLWNFLVCLVFLGLGWNFSFIGGTRLLTAGVPKAEATRLEGLNDTFVQGSAATGAVLAGFLVSRSWNVVLIVAAPIVVLNVVAMVSYVLFRWARGETGLRDD